MRLLLDQGTPRSTARHLDAYGIEAVHVADIGLSTATDSQILDYARSLAQPDRQCARVPPWESKPTDLVVP